MLTRFIFFRCKLALFFEKNSRNFIKFFSIFIFFQNINIAAAIDNDKEDRARVIAPRNDRFYKNDIIRKYINFNAEYESDYNSKQRLASVGHFYRSKSLINEVDFLRESYEIQQGKDYGYVRNKNLYDFQISTKAILFDSQDYITIYNRSKYDNASSYYYDITSAIGVGRMFFDDRLEIDVGIGHSNVKEYDEKTTFSPSFRTEFDLIERLHFIQRGYMFFSDEATDYQLRTRLQYPLTKRLYLQVTHDFDKRTYSDIAKNISVNKVHRRVVFGFRYDLSTDTFF